MKIRLLLADDNALLRDGIARMLEADGRFVVVGQVANGTDAVAATAELNPDVVLLDLHMPGMPGEDAIKRIRRRHPEVRIGVFTDFTGDERTEAAISAGAGGFIPKDTSLAQLSQAVVDLARGQTFSILRALPRRVAPAAHSRVLRRLTPRELEVLRSLASNGSYEAIAQDLGISPKTLRNHISNIYHKLHIHHRTQALVVAVREGVVDPD
jgi:DNA-binding NarL/FixJ family response regulator